MASRRPFLRCVLHGNLSSGKSTLLKNLAMVGDKINMSMHPVEENLEEWTSFTGQETNQKTNILKSIYYNPEQKFENQMFILSNLMKNYWRELEKATLSEKDAIVLERTVEDNLQVFSAGLTKKQVDIAREVADQLVRNDHGRYHDFDLIFYLRSSPEKCFERLKKRNREGEELITLNDLNKLHVFYEKWWLDRDFFPETCARRSESIDADRSPKEVCKNIILEMVADLNRKKCPQSYEITSLAAPELVPLIKEMEDREMWHGLTYGKDRNELSLDQVAKTIDLIPEIEFY